MKKLLSVFWFLIMISTSGYCQNEFYRIITGLEEIGYYVKPSTNCENKNILNGFGCKVDPKDNWYNIKARRINSKKALIDTLDPTIIKEIEIYFIKGKKEIQANTFGRAEIQQWTFNNSTDAEQIIDRIKRNNLEYQELIYKAPWTAFQIDNKVYFILTGGRYVLDDLPKIEKMLIEKIENEG